MDGIGARLEDVEVRIGGTAILGPVSLSIARGERWALLGPNGSGKTTLLSVVGAWRHPSRGRAWVLGERLGATDVRALRGRIGHVGHGVNDAVRARASALDVVLTGRGSTLSTWFQDAGPDDLAEAHRRLDQVGCTDLGKQSFSACSQGERQRILLARALFGRPELLLFDEPAAGLDLPGREMLLASMSGVVRTDPGVTAIVATHHLDELPTSTTHTALLRDGRLIASGPVEDTLTDEIMTRTFGIDVRVVRDRGRWGAHAAG